MGAHALSELWVSEAFAVNEEALAALRESLGDDLSVECVGKHLRPVFESAVGAYLLKLPGALYYWAEGNYEVDFVRVVDGKVIAYEVKSGLSYRTKSLVMFKKRFPKAEVIIVDKQTYINWH